MTAPTPGATTPAQKRDLWTFGRSDRWGLVAMLGLMCIGTVTAYVVAPLVAWASNGSLRVPFFSDVVVPGLDRAGLGYGEADYDVLVDDPSTAMRVLDLLPGLLWVTLVVVGCVLLMRVLDDIARGDPFRPANVSRLRILAGLLALGWPVASLVQSFVAIAVLADIDLGDLGPRTMLTAPIAPFLAGLVLALLAEAFKTGSRLRDDVDGLV